jgi:hypothetical protein
LIVLITLAFDWNVFLTAENKLEILPGIPFDPIEPIPIIGFFVLGCITVRLRKEGSFVLASPRDLDEQSRIPVRGNECIRESPETPHTKGYSW